MDIHNTISIVGAREHNLKNISIDLPKNKLIVITGPSGSGKSSLAFDIIYTEGQRRYIDSLSSYVRQFITQHGKPDVDSITGLSPAIAIDQKTTSRNPRSTVATITEIYDYVRIMFARIGVAYSPATGLPITNQTPSFMIDIVKSLPPETKVRICAPIAINQKGSWSKELVDIKKRGFARVKIDGKLAELDTIPTLDKNIPHSIEVIVDRINITTESSTRIADSIETALNLANGALNIDIVTLPAEHESFTVATGQIIKSGDRLNFSEKFCCPVSGFTITALEPRMFSFNSPLGACTKCNGLGTELTFNVEVIVPNQGLTLNQGAIQAWHQHGNAQSMQILQGLANHYKFSLDVPFEKLDEEIKKILFHGSNGEYIEFTMDDGFKKFNIKRPFDGFVSEMKRILANVDDEDSDQFEKYQTLTKCHACHGYRLRPETLAVKVNHLNIGELCAMNIGKTIKWFEDLKNHLSPSQITISQLLIKEISARLGFLKAVGLEYLSLSRESSTLSGGEAQRIRLASQIGSGLCGILYVLDEPSIGLHQSDNEKLIKTLFKLRDLGNTVIVVEHDEDTMMAADYLVDIGPKAGRYGGEIIAKGTVQEVMDNPNSVTGKFLSGADHIETPATRRKLGKNKCLILKNARGNNLKNVDLTIPLGLFVAVAGVSGGGKSTLIIDTLYAALNNKINHSNLKPEPHDEILNMENIDKIIRIDQSPIGRTPRSNPATYTAVFSLIRDWFTALPESRARGYKPGRFSFNVKGGRCENCQGDGTIKVEMHFLPDVYVKCEVCDGARYNKETLEIKYKGKSMADVLDMTIDEAYKFFSTIPTIAEKLRALHEVGLGYIKMGQSATTLSGGEAQRIKLAKELCKKATGDTLYILDEPTTGMHNVDIRALLVILHKLVDYGNTVLVIEHNLEVIKTADYIIDIGPKGGDDGGLIVAEGTPEQVAANPASITGPYLAKVLQRFATAEKTAAKAEKAKRAADLISKHRAELED